MAELHDLKITAAANTGRFPEGQAASSLNDGARELEAMLAREQRDRSGHNVASGTGAAYLVQTFRAVTAYAAGIRITFRAHVANTGAATLQVGNLAAKDLRRQGGSALAAGDIAQNQMIDAIYNASGDYFEALGVRGGAVANHLGSHTVANLPAGALGNTAFATDGRKNGETAGNGTGVLVYKDATEWVAVDSGALVVI